MDSSLDARILDLLHHRARSLAKGDPVALPIVSATTFSLPGEPEDFTAYSRDASPTVDALEAELGILESAECVCFGSGMAAIAAALFSQLEAGQTLLIPSDGYFGTRELSQGYLAKLGVEVRTCPTAKMAEADLDGVALVMAETPSNPAFDLCDLSALAARAKAAGALLVADNTTATPLGQRPLDLGFDLVVNADTKAIAGHSDALAGHVAGRDPERMARVRDWRKQGGAVLGAFEAYLVHRGLASFEVRWARMCANAMAAAEALEVAGLSVSYPGLASHPQHDLAATQMASFGSVLGCDFETVEAADRFIAACPAIVAATSFGGVHASAERRARWGDAVGDGYVRISCGVEPTDAFVAALKNAL